MNINGFNVLSGIIDILLISHAFIDKKMELVCDFELIIVFNRYTEASKPKRVKPTLDIIGVNSLWLGGLHISLLLVFPLYLFV